MTNDFEQLSLCSLVICVSSWYKHLFKSLPYFNWAICLFIVELEEFFIYSGHKSLIIGMLCEYFLPFHGLSVHFLVGVL